MTFTIVFDLDGTLVDTAPDLVAVTNAMLAEMNLPPLDLETGRVHAGRGARALLSAGMQAAGHPLPDESGWPELIAAFIARYQARIADHSRPFPGVEEFLPLARAQGFRLAVCTNKKAHLAEALLAALSLRDHFDAVVGGDTTGKGKPDPAPLHHALKQCASLPHRAVLIGDSMADVLAARAAGVPSILATWGYLDRPAPAFGADFAIDSLDDALPLLAELSAGAALA